MKTKKLLKNISVEQPQNMEFFHFYSQPRFTGIFMGLCSDNLERTGCLQPLYQGELDADQAIQCIQQQTARDEKNRQQEKLKHQKIWPQGFRKRGTGDEGLQTGKIEERIGPQGDQPETGSRDRTLRGQKIRRQSPDEKIDKERKITPSVSVALLTFCFCCGFLRGYGLSRPIPLKAWVFMYP